MEKSDSCVKCNGKEFQNLKMRQDASIDFGTFFLGDSLIPTLRICLSCGYSELWIDKGKDLDDVRKFSESRQSV